MSTGTYKVNNVHVDETDIIGIGGGTFQVPACRRHPPIRSRGILGLEWCDHMKAVIRDNLDGCAHVLGGKNTSICMLNSHLLVPWRPSIGAWALVILDEPEGDGARHARWVRPGDGVGMFITIADLGFVFGGDGRAALRTMITETLIEMWEDITCPVSTHPPMSPFGSAWRRPTSPNERQKEQAFDLLTKASCKKCAEFTSTDPDIPDI